MKEINIQILSNKAQDFCDSFNELNLDGYTHFTASYPNRGIEYYVIALYIKGIPIICIVKLDGNELRFAALPYSVSTTFSVSELFLKPNLSKEKQIEYMYSQETIGHWLLVLGNTLINNIKSLTEYAVGLNKYLAKEDLFSISALSDLRDVLIQTINLKELRD